MYQQNYFGNSDGLDTAQSSRQSSAGTGHYHHGHNNHPQHHNTQQQQIKGPEYALDTYIPQNSTVAPHQNNGYYQQQQPEPPRSNPGSPSKRVAFKGLPNQYNQHPGQHPGNAGMKSEMVYLYLVRDNKPPPFFYNLQRQLKSLLICPISAWIPP